MCEGGIRTFAKRWFLKNNNLPNEICRKRNDRTLKSAKFPKFTETFNF